MWSCAWLASTGMGDEEGGGLGEGSSADADLPPEMSIHIHAATSCFPQYITLVHSGEPVPYFLEPLNHSPLRWHMGMAQSGWQWHRGMAQSDPVDGTVWMAIAQREWREWMAHRNNQHPDPAARYCQIHAAPAFCQIHAAPAQ